MENAQKHNAFLQHILDIMQKTGSLNMELREGLQKIAEELKTIQQRWKNCENSANRGNLQEFVFFLLEQEVIFAKLEEILKALNKKTVEVIEKIQMEYRPTVNDGNLCRGLCIASGIAEFGCFSLNALLPGFFFGTAFFGFWCLAFDHYDTAESLKEKLDVLFVMKNYIQEFDAELQRMKTEVDFENFAKRYKNLLELLEALEKLVKKLEKR